MNVDGRLVDQIVARVLQQLDAAAAKPQARSAATAASHVPTDTSANPRTPSAAAPSAPVADLLLDEAVITADVLQTRINGAKRVTFPRRTVLTPTARDFLRQHRIAWCHSDTPPTAAGATAETASQARWRLLVSRANEPVLRLMDEYSAQLHWQTELVDDWKDASERAVSALNRADAAGVVVLTGSAAALACHANRNRKIRAAVVRDIAEVQSCRQELNPNLLCIDPGQRSYFELRNLFRAIA